MMLDPEAAGQQITNDLFQRAAAAEVLVVEPTIETSLGIFKPGDFSTNRLLKLVKAGKLVVDVFSPQTTTAAPPYSDPNWALPYAERVANAMLANVKP